MPVNVFTQAGPFNRPVFFLHVISVPTQRDNHPPMNQDRLALWVLALPRAFKRLLALSFDILLCHITLWTALSLRHEKIVSITGHYWIALALSVLIALPLFITQGFYRAVFRYGGWHSLRSSAPCF